MKYISAQEWELLSFFEVEPQRSDSSIAWVYDDSNYLAENDEFSLSCTIHPADKSVTLILQHRGYCLFRLEAARVEDIRVLKEEGSEVLEIVLSEQQIFQLKLRPLIEIVQRA